MKRLAGPAAAFQAIHTVRLAQSGVTGHLHALRGRWDSDKCWETVLHRFERTGCWPAASSDSTRSFTRNPSAGGLVEIRNSGPARVDEVRRIGVEIFKPGYEMIGGGKYVDSETVETKEDADHSVPYLAALALLDERDVAGAVRSEKDPRRQCAATYGEGCIASRSSGQAESRCSRKERSKGFFRNPMTWAELEAKYGG
jgi:2-methylcitrate dehydratase